MNSTASGTKPGRFWVILKSPKAILLAVVLAMVCGVVYPAGGKSFLVVGVVYLSLMKMLILPFLLAGIMLRIGDLLNVDQGISRIFKIIAVYGLLSVLALVVAGVVAAILPPAGELTAEKMQGFGKMLNRAGSAAPPEVEVAMLSNTAPTTTSAGSVVKTVAERILPGNVFSALTSGDTIKVLLFAILFGLAITKAAKNRELLSDLLHAIGAACSTLMGWFNILLPFALFVMIYDLVATSGIEVFVLMSSFLLTLGVASTVFLLLASLIMYFWVIRSIKGTVEILRAPLVMAMATQNSLLTIPVAVASFQASKTRIDDVEVIYPLGLSLFQFGALIFYVIAAVFVAQMYVHELGLVEWLAILGGAMLASLASTGAAGPLMVAMLALVCAPLRLPIEAALVLFLSVEPISDLMRTALNVAGNLAAVTVSCHASGAATGSVLQDDGNAR